MGILFETEYGQNVRQCFWPLWNAEEVCAAENDACSSCSHKRTIFPSRCCVCSLQVTKMKISLIFMDFNHLQIMIKQRVEALSPIPYSNKLHSFPVKTGNPLDTVPEITQIKQMQWSRGNIFSPKSTSNNSPKYNR